MKVRILLADDHEVMRDGLRALLEKQSDFEIVGIAGDGDETIQLAQELKPDAIVMDINMPNMNGVEATRRIKTNDPQVKILALSVHTRGTLVAQVIKAGASGYLPKSCTAHELFEGVRAIMRNRTYISPEVLDSVVDFLQEDPAAQDQIATPLTPREREVLILIAGGKTTKEIAESLYVSEKTVESHRFQIKQKLGVNNLAELIKYAIREGMITPDVE